MLTKKYHLVSLLAAIIIATAAVTPVGAVAPFIKIDIDSTDTYDYPWFSCGDFDVWAEGVHTTNIKIKADYELNIISNNAQTSVVGTIYNKTTGEYLIEHELWTWNMYFEDNYTIRSVLAGSITRITDPDGGLVWLDVGVEKFVGIYVNLLTGELIFVPPYLDVGTNPDYAEFVDTICEALR